MKTRYTLLYILTLLLSVFSVQTVNAQAKQDALYIFRNDGGFNAFFFADIDHIEYSKIDTLGVEQADYVVQEVYALDSIFRIPLNAIDSVSFVTPETKYRADAFVAKANLVDYVIASDSSTWFRVKKETPASLLPKVGDKLLIEQSCDLLPGGFSGKVTAVDQAADGITVRTERISLTEVYEQYVWKFDGSELDSEPDAARTRAGDDDFILKGREKNTVSLSGARTLGKTQLGPWEAKLTGEASVSLGYDVSWDLGIRAFLHVSVFTGVQFDATLKGNLAGDFNLNVQAAVTQTFEQMLKGKKTKEANLSVGLFLSLSAAIGISSEWKTEGDVFGMAYIHDYIGDGNDKKDLSIKGKVNKSELNLLNGNVGKLSASTGLYAKAEFNIKGNNLTLRTELGGNVEIDHDINLSDVANLNAVAIPPAIIIYPADLYKALDRNALLSSNAFFNASVAYEVGKYEDTYKPVDLTFFENSKVGGWVPHVAGTAFKRDKALQYQGTVSTNLGRNHLLDGIIQPIEVGYLTLDEKQNVIDDYWASYYDGKKSMSRTLDMLDTDAFYSVIPQVKLWGISMFTGDSVKVTLGPTKFNIERQVDAGREHDYKHLAIDSNIKNLTFTSKADWLKCEDSMTFNYEDDSVTGRELTLEWEDMPEDIYDRRARIDVAGYNQKGDVILEDSVVVVQHEDLLEFTPKSIEAEANGGTYTVNITKTNLTDLSVSTESDFCKATLKDNVITVTVSENTTAEKRYASVTIKGKNIAGKEITTFFEVSQEAGSGIGPGDTRTVTQKAFCGKWRKLDDNTSTLTTLIINEDLTYEQKEVCLEDYNSNISYKKGDVVNWRRMFGKFEFWNPDNWTELPKDYLQRYDYLKEYDKGYYVGYKQVERKVADRKYGKWLSDDNSVTMMGYFEISSDYKYMIENKRYLWVKMDENDPYYPEPYMNYKDPAYLELTDSVSYVSNIRPEPERMRYVNFAINEDMKFLTDIQATPVESFLHVDSIKNRGVYYSFDENTSLKKREGHINVQGTWPDGSIGKAVFTVRQNGGRTLENLSKIYFSGSSKAIKTIVKKHNKDGDTTDTDENSRFGVSLTATSFTVNAAGSGLKIEASDEQNAKNVTFTLSEGFKKRSKANDIVYIQDYTKKIADGTDVLKGSMKASNVPCYNDSGDKMTIRGELSDGVTISDASYMKYWEAYDPEKVSGLWYSSESYEYVNDSGNRVEIEITWNIDKWQR